MVFYFSGMLECVLIARKRVTTEAEATFSPHDLKNADMFGHLLYSIMRKKKLFYHALFVPANPRSLRWFRIWQYFFLLPFLLISLCFLVDQTKN
jgi:hypothetical protein